MSNPLHVVFLPSWYPTPELPVNGVFNQEQAKALSRARVKIGVVYPELGYWRTMTPRRVLEALRRTGLRDEDGVLTCRHHRWYMVRWQKEITTRAALAGLRRYMDVAGHPDLIHIHTAYYAGFAAEVILARYDIPYVITEHSSAQYEGLYTPHEQAAVRTIYEKAERVIMVSRAAAKVLVDADLVRADKVTVIPNMVDTGFFHPPVQRSPSPFRFLTVSLLSSVKRVDWLLRAFSQAFSPDDDVILEIGGDGEERAALEQLARELGISARVRFLGRLDRAGVRDAMQRANAFVLTSLFETFGVVLIEALATGLPVVSTDCGGPKDIVMPEVGLLVSTDQFDRLAPALRQMRETHAQYDSAAIRSYAERRFSTPVVTRQIIDVYNDVLGKAR